MSYEYRGNKLHEEFDSLIPKASVSEIKPKRSFFNKWSLSSISILIVTTVLLIIYAGNPNDKINLIEKAGGVVMKSTGKRVQQAIKTTYSKLTDPEHKELFTQFLRAHGKKYVSTAEQDERYSHFKAFLTMVDQRNEEEEAKGSYTVHGITKFADLSEAEFKLGFLNYQAEPDKQHQKEIFHATDYTAATKIVDWSDSLTTGVRDQGYCGSCWAFSVTEQLESDAIREGLLSTSDKLSAQQVVSCDSTNFGCSGGNAETAYMYIARAGGLVLESNYPYTSYFASAGTCKTLSAKDQLVTVKGFKTIKGESSMQSYVLSTGPLLACLDASRWATYYSGVVSTCGSDINHCVQIVGVDTEAGSWKVRNSWGSAWGESGYIYLQTGSNMCGIATDPTFVLPALVSSLSSQK